MRYCWRHEISVIYDVYQVSVHTHLLQTCYFSYLFSVNTKIFSVETSSGIYTIEEINNLKRDAKHLIYSKSVTLSDNSEINWQLVVYVI
jgi:hypothetical protein